jgi:hypothetical protein
MFDLKYAQADRAGGAGCGVCSRVELLAETVAFI